MVNISTQLDDEISRINEPARNFYFILFLILQAV